MSDWEKCEMWIKRLLSAEQRQVLDGHPDWSLNPPQREEYETSYGYVVGLKEYAERVLKKGQS